MIPRPPATGFLVAVRALLYARCMAEAGELTVMLQRLRDGDPNAAAAILPLVYDHLRAIAGAQLRGRHGHTLQATALVHEAFLRLAGHASDGFSSRGHFLAVVTQAMRQILVDHFRARQRKKRGGGDSKVPIEDVDPPDPSTPGVDLLGLHQALEKLRALDARLASLAELKVFGGASNEEAAEALTVSLRTVEREWRRAKAWLERELA